MMFDHIKIFFLLFLLTLPQHVFANANSMVTFSGVHILDAYDGSLSVAELESHFKLVERKAFNPWTNRSDQYKGILITELVDKLSNNRANSIEFFAIDRYTVTFTRHEWTQEELLLVTQINGEYIPIVEQGPLKLIYTDYKKDNLEHRVSMSKWIWMIKQIHLN